MQQPPGWPPQGPGIPQGGGYGPPQPPPGPYGQNPYGQNPYGQNPYGQNPYGQGPYPPPQPRPADPVGAASNLALGLGLGSAVLCCVPVGGVAAYFGFKAIRLAKERNVATPGRALFGIVLGAVSLLATLVVGFGVWQDRKAHDARLAEVDAKTKGKLDAEELDKATACAAFEKQLLKGLYEGKDLVKDVQCAGRYDTSGKVGTLDKVTFAYAADKITVRGCLARANRWFVAGYVPFGATCPDVKLAVTKQKDASDADLEAEEDALRRTWKSGADARLADDYAAKLAKAGKLVAGEHVEKTCKDLDLGDLDHPGKGATLKLPTLDALYLANPKQADAGWDFLTVSSARTVLDEAADGTKRADGVRALTKEGGPFVVVYVSGDRALPEIKHTGLTGKGFVSGGFEGWLSVIDTRSGKVVCDTRLKFESSATVSTRRFASDDALKSALRADLVANYKNAAEAAIRDVSGGRLGIED
jgi:hypothetical protein